MKRKMAAAALAAVLAAQSVSPVLAEEMLSIDVADAQETVVEVIAETAALEEEQAEEPVVEAIEPVEEAETAAEYATEPIAEEAVASDTADVQEQPDEAVEMPEAAAESVEEPAEDIAEEFIIEPEMAEPEEIDLDLLDIEPVEATPENGKVNIEETFTGGIKLLVSKFDADKDGYLDTGELSQITRLSGSDIATGEIYSDVLSLSEKDAKALKYLPELQVLENIDIYESDSLDLSQNTKLETLKCWYAMDLKELILGENPNLRVIHLGSEDYLSLKTLDVTGLSGLEELECVYSPQTSLDLSKNTKLKMLNCAYSNLGEGGLDLSHNTKLEKLDCRDSYIKELDLSQNAELRELDCSQNDLTSLDLSHNTKLEKLNCTGLDIKELDLSKNAELQELVCLNNDLASLDLSHNTKLTYVSIGNPRLEVQVPQRKDGWQLDLAALVGSKNLDRTRIISPMGLSADEQGRVTFASREEVPEELEYTYATGYRDRKMYVTLMLTATDCTHEWKAVTDKAATCKENGLSHEECANCGERKTDSEKEIPMSAHTYEAKEIPATCTQAGSSYKECSVCGVKAEEQSIPAVGHKWKVVTDKAATCKENGLSHEECANCGERKTDSEKEIPMSAHTYETKEISATCTQAGSSYKECSVCGVKAEEQSIPAAGHKYGEYRTVKAATLFAQGTAEKTCSVCGDRQSKMLPKIPGSVKLTVTKLPLQKGKSVSIKSFATGLKKGDSIVSWTSNKKSVATVNKSGRVTGKKAGKATITVKTKSGAKATLQVTVQKAKVKTSKITGVSRTKTIKKGKKITLKPKLSPVTSQDKITYKSSNKKVATVTSKGVVKGVKKGKAIITITAGKKKATCKITVK